jgi:ABC-type branched-subunit amino acid transport system substrate-binding protein
MNKTKGHLRKYIAFFACAMLAMIALHEQNATAASPPDIKIAVVYPLSGALSRNGNLTLQGVKAAMGWVNDNGGIKSLGGAKSVPVVADSASTVELSGILMGEKEVMLVLNNKWGMKLWFPY